MGADGVLRIAMWSGPRNISTAMMRSWGARPDTAVSDEPLYAHYLSATGLDHPGAAEVIAHGETDWRSVTRRLLGPVPGGKPVWFQKHMAHHLLPDMELDWTDGLRNGLLIREPRAMLASLSRVLEAPTVEETGLPQQVHLFERLSARAEPPPVVRARDVLTDPPGMLRAMCARFGASYTDAMLAWPPGLRPTDGVWAKHWYASVARSTGFEPYVEQPAPVPERLAGVLEACEALYARLEPYALRPDGAG